MPAIKPRSRGGGNGGGRGGGGGGRGRGGGKGNNNANGNAAEKRAKTMHPSQPPLRASDDSDDSDRSLSDDDLEFVAQHGRQRLSFLDDLEREERRARDQSRLDAEEKKKQTKKGGGGRRKGEGEEPNASEGDEEEEEDDSESASGSDSEDDDDALRDYERAPRSLLDETDRRKAAAGKGGKGNGSGGGGGDGDDGKQTQRRNRSLLPVKTPTGAVLFGEDAVNAAHASAEARARRVEGITLIEEEATEKEEEEVEVEEVEEEGEKEGEEPADDDDAAAAAASDSDSSGSSGWGSPVVSDDDQEEEEEEEEEEEDEEEEASDDENGGEGGAKQQRLPSTSSPSSPLFLSAESLEAARVRIAALATRVLECPEKRLGDLRSLVAEASGTASAAAGMGRQQQDPRVTRLAILSAAAVFRDVAPGYRVRPFDEAAESAGSSFDGAGGGAAVRLSAEVGALRAFEGGLLSCYGAFLRALLRASDAGRSASSSLIKAAAAAGKMGKEGGDNAAAAAAASASASASAALSPAAAARRASGRAATRAMGSLLSALPHFNYSSDLLRALVPRLDDPDRQCASAARDAISSVFEAGGALAAAIPQRRGKSRGRARKPLANSSPSANRGGLAAAGLRRDGAQLIAELIKKKRCRCSASVLAPLAALDLAVPTLRRHGSNDDEWSKKSGKRQLGRKAVAKVAKAARHARAADPVAAARAAADPEPDAAELALLASEAAEAVFEAYFRVIKHAAASDVLRKGEEKSSSSSPAAPIPASLLAKRCPLLLPALRGLARAAPGLGTEYAADLHSALASLLQTQRAPPALCAAALKVSAGSLVGGLGDALLSVDRGGVHAALFAAIGRAPLAAATDGWGPDDTGDGNNDGDDDDDEPNNNPESNSFALSSEGGASAAGLAAAAEALLVDGGRALDAATAHAFAKRAAGAALLAAAVGGRRSNDNSSSSPSPFRSAAAAAAGARATATALGLLAVVDKMLRRSRALRAAARRGQTFGASGFVDDDDSKAPAARNQDQRKKRKFANLGVECDSDEGGGGVVFGRTTDEVPAGATGAGRRRGSSGSGNNTSSAPLADDLVAAAAAAPREPLWELSAAASAPWACPAVRAAAAALAAQPDSGAAAPRCPLLCVGGDGAAAAVAASQLPKGRRPPLPPPPPPAGDVARVYASMKKWFVAARDASSPEARRAAAVAAEGVAAAVAALTDRWNVKAGEGGERQAGEMSREV